MKKKLNNRWLSKNFKLKKAPEQVEREKVHGNYPGCFINLVTQIFHKITSCNRLNRLCSALLCHHFTLLVFRFATAILFASVGEECENDRQTSKQLKMGSQIVC